MSTIKPSDSALVVIDHGSRRAEANELLEDVARRVASRGRYLCVEAAHMELAEPTLAMAVDRCVEAGALRIIVVPYFLAMGRHMTRDIPALVEECQARHPDVAFDLAQPLGSDDRMIEIVLDRAAEAPGD